MCGTACTTSRTRMVARRPSPTGMRSTRRVWTTHDVVRTQTERWLEDVGDFGHYAGLVMRKAGDRRPDTEIKLEMIRELGLTPNDVLCIFDDRQCVVDMWRANGYRVMQVAAWKE